VKLNPVFRKLLLLAPGDAPVPASFKRHNIRCDRWRYADYLAETQELRGRIYREDGAIDSRQLTSGRHVVECDRTSWHLLVLDQTGKVRGCVRYRHHHEPAKLGFSELTAAQSSLASCSSWGGKMRAAVEDELLLSQALGLPFIEIGGWALDAEIRGSIEALRMVLAAYAFSREFGGAVGLATATVRHSSASILRRIGGRPLEHGGEEVPSYTDHHYNCTMEILRFYSWALNPRFDVWMDDVAREVRNIAVICAAVPRIATEQPKHEVASFRHRWRVLSTRSAAYPLKAIA
jgi:hypothetical protein